MLHTMSHSMETKIAHPLYAISLLRPRKMWHRCGRSGRSKPMPCSFPFQSCKAWRSEEHTSELQSHHDLVCRLLLEKKKTSYTDPTPPRPARTQASYRREIGCTAETPVLSL